MNYTTLAQVKEAFIEGGFAFEKAFKVGNKEYTQLGSTGIALEAHIHTSSRLAKIYKSGDEALMFVWAGDEKKRLVPADIITGTLTTSTLNSVAEAIDLDDPNIIGDTVQVKFMSLPGAPALKGKVDTGADISSLHADKWAVQGNRVQFICSKLSPNTITVPLHDQQAVKSASGIQYRPVIELSVKINDKVMNNMLFNIADREKMDYPVLIGQNILEKGKFLINPSLREDEKLKLGDDLLKQINEVSAPAPSSTDEKVQQAYHLLQYVQTEVSKTLKDMEP